MTKNTSDPVSPAGQESSPLGEGRTPPETPALPLAGIKVLELGTLIAGPFCARMLAEFGAEVIKVESPDGGDPIRKWRVLKDGTSLWWSVQSRNKKSLTLNMKHARGRAIARQLALEADIIIENYRPGVLEKWDIGYEQLKAVNPSTIMVRLSGFGQTGPMKDLPGFGAIGESMGGLRYVSGHPDRPPVRVGVSIGDSVAALHGVIGAMMALRHRDATGGRLENIVIAGNGDAIFKRLMLAMGRIDMAGDPELERNDGRVKRTQEIDDAIQAWCDTQDIDGALTVLKAADVPAGKIYSVRDMMVDPQFLAREMFEQHHFADGTPVKLPAISPKLSATPGRTKWIGPTLGQHNNEVLQALGYSAEEIAAMQQDGVL
jgi:crotonobetainyl-CoA:carnitine CoA-transferase CaiB-like acyl-CoA transferase